LSGSTERIGVFGGAFDPPHLGHSALARAAVEQLGLARLHVVPTGEPLHKHRTLTDARHRLAMCQLAFADVPQATVDACEMERSGPSFTVDTLEALQREHPNAQLCLLIGQDQAQTLQHWHRAGDLARLAIIYVAARPASAGSNAAIDPIQTPKFALQWLHMPAMEHSATDIRQRLAQHQSVDSLVAEPVARYIDHHHLYQTP
jgi:nicotinate-nucleotide adenylyltransferase